jgi:hypothetical protein
VLLAAASDREPIDPLMICVTGVALCDTDRLPCFLGSVPCVYVHSAVVGSDEDVFFSVTL